jgi:hypothetical protein
LLQICVIQEAKHKDKLLSIDTNFLRIAMDTISTFERHSIRHGIEMDDASRDATQKVGMFVKWFPSWRNVVIIARNSVFGRSGLNI